MRHKRRTQIYFGYHYASDILAGAVIGITIMAIVLTLPIPRRVHAGFERFQTQGCSDSGLKLVLIPAIMSRFIPLPSDPQSASVSVHQSREQGID